MITRALFLFSDFLGLWPESAISFLARCLGWAWWNVVRYRRGVILENLARAFPERSDPERRSLARGACDHLARTLLEFLRIRHYARIGFEGVRFEGMENYEAAKSVGKGVLCLSGHLGSFEVAVAAVADRARPISLVVKPFPAVIDAFVNGVRRGCGLTVIPADGALRPVMKALKRNESVVFVLDQNATRSIGVFVPFFGKEACTMSALAVLALRTGASVIAATIHREGAGTHVLRIHPTIPIEERATREETVRHMTGVYTRFLEDAIRRCPEQWFWTHKRWRTRPMH